MFDDLFCFHDKLAQQYLGLEQKIVYLFIITVSITYVITFRRIILSTDYIFLLIALAFLGSSVFWEIEYLYPWMRRTVGEWQNFFEDAGKWLGIAFWTSYFAIVSFKFIKAQTLNKGVISVS